MAPDAVYDAAFRRAGMLRVDTIEELFAAVETLGMARPPGGERLAMVTNGAGIGVLAADALADEDGRLAELAPDTLGRLRELLPQLPAPSNPLDLGGDAPGSRYADALEVLCADPGVDAVLLMHCPSAVVSGTEVAQAVVDTLQKPPFKSNRRGVFTSWLGEATTAAARQLFAANRIPSYPTPDNAVRGIMQMVHYRRIQELLMETPAAIPEGFTPDATRVRQIIEQALSEDRRWLTEIEAKQIVAAYAIPVVATRAAATPGEAAAAAAGMGAAVTVKIRVAGLTASAGSGRVSVRTWKPRKQCGKPRRPWRSASARRFRQARLPGFTVQPVIRRPHAHQLLMGIIDTARFGPMLRFGHGGYAARLIQDEALALPPCNLQLARELMARTRIHRLLEGCAGAPAADRHSIALTLVKVSQLACDIAAIGELEINPLLADANGVLALDVRIRVARTTIPPAQRLAIQPYPRSSRKPSRSPMAKPCCSAPYGPKMNLCIRSCSPDSHRKKSSCVF